MLCMALVLSGAVRADSYEYDELGNLKTLTTPRGARAYTYDEIQRLDTETGYTGNRDHAYDLNGNRTTDGASAPGTPTTATYTSNTNRIATLNGAAVTLDAAGQITNDGLNSYTWDDAGRLKTVSRGGQLRATYHYDHKHRRTRKVTTAVAPQGAKTLVYHYDDQDRLIAETTQTGTPLRSYAWSDENLIGQVEYVANATNTGYEIGRIVYYELDHLGTPRQARERTGTVVWRWESDGYGNTLPNEDPDGNGQKTYVYLRFPGQYFDEESGLHYNWHRYYVPRLGRYLSSDPIGVVGGINTYRYANGNPLSFVDPLGLESEVVIWQPAGWGSSSFGHVSVNINGTTYSFGPDGMWTGQTSQYMGMNSFRSGVGTMLKLTPQQEKKFEACLKNPQGNYNAVANNCGAPAQYCLQSIRINLGGFTPLPVNFGNNLINSGIGQSYNFYPASRPSTGSSAPWAR
ncbi:hypothetical protein METUNv1_03554 [Methyloversatilis universalis FAM5]|uniref:Teneurin-like YD-shell domain-containing protein n=2 Tax=Methyloversatilis universalis TaxID=378211 RepID=F5RGW3_METUF|nr:hypothetical protein METUNv1_03554 [Methyloversatilis universalis FAM5]